MFSSLQSDEFYKRKKENKKKKLYDDEDRQQKSHGRGIFMFSFQPSNPHLNNNTKREFLSSMKHMAQTTHSTSKHSFPLRLLSFHSLIFFPSPIHFFYRSEKSTMKFSYSLWLFLCFFC
jgi:hypothetical protein